MFVIAGNINSVITFRLSLVFVPFFAFFASYLLDVVLRRIKLQWCLPAVLIGMFFFFHPLAVNDVAGKSYILGRRYVIEQKLFKQFADKDNILIIAGRPNMYTVYNDFGAIDFEYANRLKDEVLNNQKRHLFGDIIVIQEISYATGEPISGETLDSDYRLKTLYEIQNDAVSFMRYSVCERQQ